MAYQPKYAKNRAKPTPQPPRQELPRPVKKQKKLNPWFILVGLVVIPLALLATRQVLTDMLPTLGRPAGQAAYEKTGDMTIMDRFDTFVVNAKADALDGVLSVKKRFWLAEDTKVAPEPDQSKFGETDDPSTLGWLLEAAADILEGQQTYFSLDTKLYPGSKVMYYLDESIFAVSWKEVHDTSVYTYSEVKISHPSQFRRHLAGGEYGSEMQFMTTEMAESVNAVVASSGDFYRFRDFGTVVYEGKVRRVEGTYAHTCYIDRNGDLHFSYGGEVMDMAAAEKFVADNDIQFSLAFGPVLIDNGVRCEPDWYGVGEVSEEYARAALCQMGKLHYLVVAANNEGAYQGVPTVHAFTNHIEATGAKMAYCLDGGQTAAIVMNDKLINRVVYGYQRKISDIIYFATAVPDGG
ncbi:MAG: phosphodiester glycosidase family protein [Eubacteriales bacterium]|nr:phosphodiester glycosidase family protein [Eubacteriales bacterium]